MARGHGQAMLVALSVVLGVALAASITTHMLVYYLHSWQACVTLLVYLSGVGVAVAYWAVRHVIRSTVARYGVRACFMLLGLSLVLSSLVIVAGFVRLRPISWKVGTGAQLGQPVRFFDEQVVWGERRSAFEVHATDGDPQWIWRAYGDLPRNIILFGGTLRLWVTQPEWAVFDAQKHVNQGGDGVEVRLLIERNRDRAEAHRVKLNLHVRPEQRHWQMVELSLSAGSRRLIIESLPGPPGSNNWFDRVWVSVERPEALAGAVTMVADWFSIGFLVYFAGLAALWFSRSPDARWKNVTVSVASMIIFFLVDEIVLRATGFEPYVRTFPGQHQNRPNGADWARSDPSFGWVVRRAPDINPQGFRDTRDFDTVDLKSGKVRVMVLGDSFMLGASVSRDENVPNLLEAKLQNRYEFFNLGVAGWGIDQMYLAYQKYKEVIQPHIIMLAFIDDDVSRVLEAYRVFEGMNKPSFAVKGGELVRRTSALTSQVLVNRVMEESVLFSLLVRQIYLMTDARGIVKWVFQKMAEEASDRRQTFVVIRIPTKDNARLITTLGQSLYDFKGMFKGTDVQYLEPFEEMREVPNWVETFYFKDDGHMSGAGNRYLADYIYKHVFEKLI